MISDYELVSQLSKLVEMAYNTHPILAHARAWLHRNQPFPEASDGVKCHCWLDEDPDVRLPQPCVFDDPETPLEDCLFAVRILQENQPKTECPYYRATL
jgi:hypothetical protein